MAVHQKPTQEELKEQERLAIEEVERIEAGGTPEEEPEPAPDPEPEPIPDPEEEQAAPSEEEQKEIDRLKKENSASSRENQKIYAKNRVINQALIDADEIPEPTEEELTKEFSEWDVMSDTEKTFARETVISRNWREKISQAKEQATKIEKWNESVLAFVEDPKTLADNPELEGKTEEFQTFATEETNNSVPFKILISAFLHNESTGKKPNKGRMFEVGSGGPNDKPQPKTGKITLEEARNLRESTVPGSYEKYKELLKTGKIELDI